MKEEEQEVKRMGLRVWEGKKKKKRERLMRRREGRQKVKVTGRK